MSVLDKKDFKVIKKLVELLFPNGYEVESHYYKDGKYVDYDGLGGYETNPVLKLFIAANDKRYKLDFYRSYQMIGPYWYWKSKEEGISGTCFFENYDYEKILKYFNDHDYINSLHKFEIDK